MHPEPVEFGRHHRVLVGRCRHGEVDAEGLAWAGGRARRCVTVWVVCVYKRFEKQTKIVFFTANTDPMKFLPTDLTGLYVEKKKGGGGEGENTHGWGYLGRRVRGPVRKTHSRLESAHLFQTGR